MDYRGIVLVRHSLVAPGPSCSIRRSFFACICEDILRMKLSQLRGIPFRCRIIRSVAGILRHRLVGTEPYIKSLVCLLLDVIQLFGNTPDMILQVVFSGLRQKRTFEYIS